MVRCTLVYGVRFSMDEGDNILEHVCVIERAFPQPTAWLRDDARPAVNHFIYNGRVLCWEWDPEAVLGDDTTMATRGLYVFLPEGSVEGSGHCSGEMQCLSAVKPQALIDLGRFVAEFLLLDGNSDLCVSKLGTFLIRK
jgi:hypothetical protein